MKNPKLDGHDKGFSDALFGRERKIVLPKEITPHDETEYTQGYSEGYEMGLNTVKMRKSFNGTTGQN